MKKELNYSLEKLNKAYLKLKVGSEDAQEELKRDGVIQRFEFTFELLWKTLKIYLKEIGTDATSPREVFEEIFRKGWIQEEAVFLDMLKDRNNTVHTYKEEFAQEIFERIKNKYICPIEQVIEVLKEKST